MAKKRWFLNIQVFKTTTDEGKVFFLFERYVLPLGRHFNFVINNNKINHNLRTMKEVVTLKPNAKLTKKKYRALGNLILKRLVPSHCFQKNHRSYYIHKHTASFLFY
jgi:hypothetical protein